MNQNYPKQYEETHHFTPPFAWFDIKLFLFIGKNEIILNIHIETGYYEKRPAEVEAESRRNSNDY
jgi:hypothetical protein